MRAMSDSSSSFVYTNRNERKDEMKKIRVGALCSSCKILD
jgi:hypothetical protein